MFLSKLFERISNREPAPVPAPASAPEPAGPRGNHGWVELVQGKVIVHDPIENGRFASLIPEGGVRLWVNGSEVTELTVVSSSDQIRWEADTDPHRFFRLTMAPDAMSVELTLTADPHRLPDAAALVGQHPIRVRPGYSPQAAPRPVVPKQVILDQLRDLGVTFGIDETAIETELAAKTFRPTVIARGQEALPHEPGHWIWKLDEWGMVEPGQVMAVHEGEQPGRPRITVQGETTRVYDEGPTSQAYQPGTGVRLVGNRLVAGAQGRGRLVPTATGSRVDVVPVHVANADVTSDLAAAADIIVRGNVRGARITTSGEILVMGSIEKAELTAGSIIVRGSAALSKLMTLPAGHYAPLRSELTFIQKRVEELGDAAPQNQEIRALAFKELGTFIRATRRKADELQVSDKAFGAIIGDLTDVVIRSDAAAGYNRSTAQLLSVRLNTLLEEAAQVSVAGDVQVGSLAQTTIWAGRDVTVQDNIVGSAIFCGGNIQTSLKSTLSQADLVCGGDARLGVLASLRGTSPVTVRARRIEADEVQPGCAFEFGAQRREFPNEMVNVACGVNARGGLVVKQRE